MSPAQIFCARPVAPTWYPPVQSTVQPFGFDGGGFRPLRVGEGSLGREMVVGKPRAGTLPGASRLGSDTRVG